jgi:16S rRNA U516 pseudouridylate synthase RsuA-like enzyme
VAVKTGPNSFNITLTEGKTPDTPYGRGVQVVELERVRILNIRLEDLKPNATRPIKGDELATAERNKNQGSTLRILI